MNGFAEVYQKDWWIFGSWYTLYEQNKILKLSRDIWSSFEIEGEAQQYILKYMEQENVKFLNEHYK